MAVTTSSLSDLARRLQLPTSTVDRWIRQGRIPVRRSGALCLFDERELDVWARDHKLTLTEQSGSEHSEAPAGAPTSVSLAAALRRGGVHHHLPGSDVTSVLEAVSAIAPLAEAHRAALLARLQEREELSSTGIGQGVAFPHPRSPMTEVVNEPSVSACFLAEAVDMGAMDGQPVWLLFLILAPTVKVHLRLLARLAHWLRAAETIEALRERPDGAAFVALLESIGDEPVAPAVD